MARQNHGPLTRAKGKLGGVVYQQYEGMQIAREYQPNVKNPQTETQTENRAKFKLSSQIVSQFQFVLIERLSKRSIYTRTKRADAVSAIYSVVSTSTPENPQVLVTDVVSAINAKSIQDFEAPTTASGPNGVINVTAASGDVVFVTVVGYNADGSFYGKTDEKYTSDGTAKSFNAVSSNSNVLMVCALRATTDAGRATLENAELSGTGSQGAKWGVAISRGIAAGDILVSALNGAYLAGA